MKYDLELAMDEQNALSIILKQIHSNSLILEFGPANGRMTKYLKEMLECDVYIVELDEEAAKDAMKYAADGLVGDIEQFEWLDKWRGVEFDYIIFADVLEHLYNPQEALSKARQLLKYDGKVFISVPNIGHNSIMINLYRNIFSYTPLGLLDNTHIHFFAYNTLKEFCHYAGYFPIVEDATYSNVGENEIACSFDDIDKDIGLNLKKRDFGNVYQYVFTLQKEEYVKCNCYNTDYRIRKSMPIGEVKIYLDRGNGFCEDNSIAYHIYMKETFSKEIILENCEEICAIRIDPLNMGGIFKFTKIQIVDQEGDKSWTIDECVCSGKNIGGYLFSDHDDPQVIIENTRLNVHAKLMIEIEYICVSAEKRVIKSCIDIVEKNEVRDTEAENELLQYIAKLNEKENEIKLLNEEIDRRAIELEHRMDEINHKDNEIEQQKNRIVLLDQELDRRAIELEHRMDEINLRDKEIDKQRNELKLINEEMDRRAVELEHRMEEINLRDKEIDKQRNELKLLNEELERRAMELNNRMDKINELQEKLDYIRTLNLNGVIKWYFSRGKK